MSYNVIKNFSKDIKKVAQEMRREGKKPGMPVYVLTMADKIERIADSYEDSAYEVHMGEDL